MCTPFRFLIIRTFVTTILAYFFRYATVSLLYDIVYAFMLEATSILISDHLPKQRWVAFVYFILFE